MHSTFLALLRLFTFVLRREWFDAIPEHVRAEALKFACNARHVRVVRQRKTKTFSDAAFLAEAAARDHRIALADARGSATRIFPSAAAPREHRPSSRAPQIEDPSKLAAMPDHVFDAAFKAACNAKVVRFRNSQCALRNPPNYTLERVFGTTDVDVINALSEEEYQDALEQGKAAAGLKPVDKQAYRSPNQAASIANQAKKYYAAKEANNGKSPKFQGDPSCPDAFDAFQKEFPAKFRAHLPKCESCRKWAYKVYQLQAAPVGAFPTARSVVKNAAKVQEKGVKFPGQIDVADFTARRDAAAKAAKPKKRRGAKGAAPAKKPKK